MYWVLGVDMQPVLSLQASTILSLFGSLTDSEKEHMSYELYFMTHDFTEDTRPTMNATDGTVFRLLLSTGTHYVAYEEMRKLTSGLGTGGLHLCYNVDTEAIYVLPFTLPGWMYEYVYNGQTHPIHSSGGFWERVYRNMWGRFANNKLFINGIEVARVKW